MKSPVKTKIAAFTIPELLVTMALTATLTMLAYRALNSIQDITRKQTTYHAYVGEIVRLKRTLQLELRKCTAFVETTQNTFEIQGVSDSLSIDFYDRRLIFREGEIIDTFRLEIDKIEIINESTSALKSPLIKQITFSTILGSRSLPLTCNMVHDAATRIRFSDDLYEF